MQLLPQQALRGLQHLVGIGRPVVARYIADQKAKGKMAFNLAKGGEDVAAYLASVVPAP